MTATAVHRRAPATDLGLAAAVAAVVGTAVSADLAPGPAPGPLAYAFAAGFGALVLLRRRWPLVSLLVTAAALLVYYRLGLPPIGLAVPAAVALYSAAERGRTGWAAGTAAVLLVVSTAARVLEGDAPAFLVGYELPASVGLMAATVALGDAVRSRRGWQAELRRRSLAAEWEREREAAARVEQERVRIARDLHDLLAHTTTVISLHADVAREALHDDPAAAERALALVRRSCRDVAHELRATLGALRSGDADAPAGLDRLDELVEPVRAAGLDVAVVRRGEPVALPAVIDATAYRVVQEALSNVLRHAAATAVTVELDHRPDALLVEVRDDGRSAPVDGPSGYGLVGMRERLALLGGDLDVAHRPDGFAVRARLPRDGR
jgi:signal transduction histidine kinase